MAWYSNKRATTVFHEPETGDDVCLYRQTPVVRWNDATGVITLSSGGYRTATTKRRMNEVSEHYGLRFRVFQTDHKWYVTLPSGRTYGFVDGMKFNFKPNSAFYDPPSAWLV